MPGLVYLRSTRHQAYSKAVQRFRTASTEEVTCLSVLAAIATITAAESRASAGAAEHDDV